MKMLIAFAAPLALAAMTATNPTTAAENGKQAACPGEEYRVVNGTRVRICHDGSYQTCLVNSAPLGAAGKAWCDKRKAQGKLS
jgi:hypothetical protein